jgi:exosortase O
VGFNTLSAALFILFVYGLSGHCLKQSVWRSLFVPTSLLILVLPFEHYLDIYLGFPLRLLSADWASTLLQHTGLPLVTTESILMIDNRAAIVDLDCSGIKSLWIGLIFYLLLTWIEQYKISWRWLIIGLIYVFLLITANVARITILVLLELVLEEPELAAMLHQSLGLLGFGIASAAIWWVLQTLAATQRTGLSNTEREQPLQQIKNQANSFNPITLSGIILSVIIGMIMLYQPQTLTAQPKAIKALSMPPSYALKTSSLNPQEQSFFSSNQAQANKYRLTLSIEGKPVKVAMVLVWSRAWKTHHVPENCYLSQGYSIEDQGVWNLPEHTLRYLKLSQVKPNSTLGSSQTAAYWFQSASDSTPDYSARVIDNIFHPGRNWVMTSILFDQAVTPQQIAPFIKTLKQAIGDQFHDIQ